MRKQVFGIRQFQLKDTGFAGRKIFQRTNRALQTIGLLKVFGVAFFKSDDLGDFLKVAKLCIYGRAMGNMLIRNFVQP